MQIKIKRRRRNPQWWESALIGIGPVIAALALTTPWVLAAGANPLRAFYHLTISPFTSYFDLLEMLIETLPLIFTGLAVAIAFRAKYWNIGAEGQLYAGATAATWAGITLRTLPAPVLLPLALVLGFAAGGLWSLLCRAMRKRADEAISSLLLNWVMIYMVGALLSGPWMNPETKWPESPAIANTAHLPVIIPRSRVHLGLVIAATMIVTVWWLLNYSVLGFEIRTVGSNPTVAKRLGMKTGKTITTVAMLSGGLAGLAGSSLICGTHFRLTTEISPGYGYTGIAVASLGGLHPLGVMLSALFFGALNIGGQTMQRMTQTPAALADVVQSAVLLTALVSTLFTRYRIEITGR